MSEERTETSGPRVRAWMLIRAEEPRTLAQRIYDELGFQGSDTFVVVRADVVDWTFNIVIPLDTESQGALDEICDRIRGMPGVAETLLLPVLEHHPWPPQLANGYISDAEADADPESWDKPTFERRRLGHSPGHNPWG
jgi:hypothetical protein